MQIGKYQFHENRTHIMGILNVTPDSFSDGGKYNGLDGALFHCEAMLREGAEVIDVGGESTRPGYTPITETEEIQRVAPVIQAIKERFDIAVSIDTYKSAVAEAAVQAGADMINDIWGFRHDAKMAKICEAYGVACCLMHNRKEAVYQNFLEDVLTDLRESIAIAKNAGVAKDKILLDPGVGFAKSYEQNLEITNHCEMLLQLGCPVLLGTSRKSMIGLTLDLPVEERLEGTLATTVLAVIKGMHFVRVHDVEANRRAILMTERILGKG